MSQLRIIYDPIYNAHEGYHGELIKNTEKRISWVKSNLINYYEECVWTDKPYLRYQLLNVGDFKTNKDADLLFSPHMLLENPHCKYVMDLEDVWWLFGDRYEDIYNSKPIYSWKIQKFEELIVKKDLVRILWWTESAIIRFKEFCVINNISEEVKKVVLNKSSVLYPSAPVVKRKLRTEQKGYKHFIAVFSKDKYYRKGGDVILRVFRQLYIEGIRNWKLDIYGGVPGSGEQLLVENICIKENISKSLLQECFAQSDIFLFLSRADTFGTVLVEAMNTNCYILAAYGKNTFASKEILEGYPNCTLIESKKYDELFDQLEYEKIYLSVKKLIQEPVIYKKWDSKYTEERVCNEFISIINNVK